MIILPFGPLKAQQWPELPGPKRPSGDESAQAQPPLPSPCAWPAWHSSPSPGLTPEQARGDTREALASAPRAAGSGEPTATLTRGWGLKPHYEGQSCLVHLLKNKQPQLERLRAPLGRIAKQNHSPSDGLGQDDAAAGSSDLTHLVGLGARPRKGSTEGCRGQPGCCCISLRARSPYFCTQP